MNRIGILFTAFNCLETVHKSLKPWVDARAQKLDNREYVISAVSVPFAEYREMNLKVDDTPQVLSHEYYSKNLIDSLIIAPQYIDEATARNNALLPLLDAGCDVVLLWDADEIVSQKQISAIFQFAELDKFTSWFKLSYKNYVFDENTYLVEPFTPPRLFRVNTNGYKLDRFFWDNDIQYKGTVVQHNAFKEKIASYKELPSKIIPKNIAWIPHLSWMNNEKGRSKVAYQKSHFQGVCSYDWDDSRGGLIFNEQFYKATNQPIPKVVKEFS